MIRHFKGSRNIGFWCAFMFGMERHQQHDDPELRKTTTFRILKDRFTGNATGETFWMQYDQATSHLHEVEGNPHAQASPFKDETAVATDCPF